jgi:hypothetical protein
MSYLFDENLIAALRLFGCYTERKVEISQISSGWKKEGYRVFPEASKFVKFFGGLTLTHPAYGGGAFDESHFDPSVATRRIDRS